MSLNLIYFTPLLRLLLFCFVLFDTGFLCSFGACPGTRSVDQGGLELKDLPASASGVLGLKACATTAQFGTSCCIPGWPQTFEIRLPLPSKC